MKEYAIFLAKLRTGKIGKLLSDAEWVDLVTKRTNPSALNSLSFDDLLPPIVNWTEFKLCNKRKAQPDGELFGIEGTPHRYTLTDIERLGPGKTLHVTTSNKNNGVVRTCNLAKRHEETLITVDSATDGKAFFQQFPFVGSDHVECLYPRSDTRLNVFTGLFIVAMMNHWLGYYGYGRKRAQKRLMTETVALPSSDGIVPDWALMEEAVKRMPYSSCLVEWEDSQ